MEFKETVLSDIAKINMGQSPKSEFYNDVSGFPFLQGNRTFGHLYPVIDTFTEKVTKKANVGDILMSVRAPVGDLNIAPVDLCIGRGLCSISVDESLRSFVYYLLKNEIKNLENQSTGTIFSSVNRKTLENLKVNAPTKISDQKNIGDFLWSLDEKIDLNNKTIANLEELSQTLFKRWFVDFEFPNEEGNPYNSSDGKMKDTNLGNIPEEWTICSLEEMTINHNSIRKPLSRLERDKQDDNYPYYGATKIIDYVEDYLFDGKYILVGEDGTVKTDQDRPFTQYVWGQFWVSNHAHILKGKDISDELLLLYLQNINIEPFITGAVQPKLNKRNLNSIKLIIPDEEIKNKIENVIQPLFKKIRELHEESNSLQDLRDTLLPKLMSGEIELPDDLEVENHAELLQ